MVKQKPEYNSKPEYDRIYKTISSEVGMGRYLYAASGEPFFSALGLNSLRTTAIGVCAGTGSVLQMNFVYLNFCIPKGSVIAIERVFRPCHHNDIYHGNADDYLYFPVSNGNIVRVTREDAPDHIFPLAASAGLGQIISACHLPEQKYGPISNYVGNGALMPIRIDCPDGDVARVIDITRKDKK